MHKIEGLNNVAGQFNAGPPATVVTPEWLNAIQNEIINTITYFGGQIYAAEADTEVGLRDVIIRAIQGYDYVTYSQSTFVELFERTGANAYQVKDDYKSILIRNMGVGYNLGNILSDGDTWGTVNLNNCTLLKFENGAKIDLSFYEMSIVCTDDNTIEGMWLDGGSNALARSNTLKLIDLDTAKRVSFKDLKITDFYIQDISFSCVVGTNAEESMQFNNTYFNNIDAAAGISDTSIFEDCYNIVNCTAVDLNGGDGNCKFFNGCINMQSVYAKTIRLDTPSLQSYVFYECKNLSSCQVNDFEGAAVIMGFRLCENLSSCKASSITSTSSTAWGFYECTQVSASEVNTMDSVTDTHGFAQCDNISACYVTETDCTGTGDAYGFSGCSNISACKAFTIDADSGDAVGFYGCTQITSCTAIGMTSASGTAAGFDGCTRGAALYTLEAVNPNNDWIDSSDANITNKVSTPDIWT